MNNVTVNRGPPRVVMLFETKAALL